MRAGHGKSLRFFMELTERPRAAPFELRSLPIYVLVGSFIILISLAFVLTDFSYDGSMNRIYLPLPIFLIGAMALRHLNLPRVAGSIEGIALKLCIGFAGGMMQPIIVATSLPLADEMLLRWDATMGFEWLVLMNWLHDKPDLIHILDFAYRSFLWQPLLIVPMLFLTRQEVRGWTFLFAWALAMAVTMALFPLFPAVGPIVHHDVALPGITAREGFLDVFFGARDGSLRELGITTIRGMVTMPSFHAAAAVMLGWGFAGLRYVKWPFLLLNILMFAATIPVGGHYLVDVIAGAIVALGAIAVARLTLASPWFGANSKPSRSKALA